MNLILSNDFESCREEICTGLCYGLDVMKNGHGKDKKVFYSHV
jgi:hypothetical protein